MARKKFVLNNGFKDPSFLREKLALDLMNDNGINAPRCTYARVYLNGSYWGLYTLVEAVDKTFLDNRFDDNEGNLFKGDPSGDFRWYGTAASGYYNHYELHTNETANDWTDLIHAMDVVNNTPANLLADSIHARFKTQNLLRAWAANNLLVNLDAYLGSGHNYYVYHDSTANEWRWIA
ncbi:MAG: CotH kinase family protein [Flavobacteriales bacterium]|nr:CotH kinase family protein [Flavobacteriales bacterium]